MQARVAALVFWLTVAVVLASVLLPNTGIAWMRDNWPWFNWPMLLIERADSSVNLVHVVLFLLLGMATRIAIPRWHVGGVVFAFLLFAIATELAQLLVPGRHPRVSDMVVDVLAGVSGWAAMSGAIAGWARLAKSVATRG